MLVVAESLMGGENFTFQVILPFTSQVYLMAKGRYCFRYAMFPGVIDSTQVRAGSSSGRRSLLRGSERNIEVANLQEALRQQERMQKAQEEAIRQHQEHARIQQEYYAAQFAQQQALLQVRKINKSPSFV